MNKIPAIFCWSGGKDSSFALYKCLQEGHYEIKYLLSTFNGNYHRLSMHGVRETLIQTQADRIGIPLLKVFVTESSNEEYEAQMNLTLLKVKSEGIETVLFGDIFLEDLRAYRESKLAVIGMQAIFPIWKIPTNILVNDFVEMGFKSYTCCINDGYLDECWLGRFINKDFIEELPENVDPCGENGEFHSFCFEGPLFNEPIKIRAAERKYQPIPVTASDPSSDSALPNTKGFWYVDLILI